MQPLKSLRVLDLSKVIAGPLCGQYLGHFGADVIKVEPLNGDDSRAWPPHKEGHGATYLTMNHNKRSLAVDLKSEDGIRLVHELVRSCDIVIQGFGSGAAERLRVDYDTLRAIKPDIIYCEISGYGRTGPLGTKPGYDVMAQAFSGMMASMGESDGGLVRASFSPVDQGTGMHAFASILVAVIERQRTGKGCYLEISLFATALHFMNYMAQAYWQTGKVPRKMGSAHGAIAPYQAFRTADGHIMLGAGNDGQWQRLCQILGLEEAISDPRFATSASRVAHYGDTVALVQNQLLLNTSADWLGKFEAAGLPCSIVNELDEALQHPQVEALGLVVESAHAKLGRVKQVAYPTSFAGSSRAENRTPPMLGEHSREILEEMGVSPDQIDSLLKAGIVRQPS